MYMYNIWVKINTGLNVYKRKLVLLCISQEIMWKMVMFYTFFKYWKIKMAIEISIKTSITWLFIWNNILLTLESGSYFDVLCCRSSSVDIGQLSDQLSQQQFYTIGMATNNFVNFSLFKKKINLLWMLYNEFSLLLHRTSYEDSK